MNNGPMRHMLVKATITETTDEGTFTAVISSVSIDRDGDIVDPAAVVKALQAWGPQGKMVPLAWDHEYDADHIIGHIVPKSVHEVDGEVMAEGWVDQSFDRGKHAWRLVKSGTLGFSYGYLIHEAEPRGDGKGLHITAMDIFEVTATPIPANADTRVVSFKSLAELKAATVALEQEEEARALPDVDPEPEPEPVAVEEPEPAPKPAEAEWLRTVANEVAREEEERHLPEVDPPPAPEAHTPPAPPKPKDLRTLKALADALVREEAERRIPEVEVVEAEPVPDEPVDIAAYAAEKGVSDGDLLVFARGVLAKHGTPVEDLEAQVKRLEREEQAHKEAAIVKSAEVDLVQGQIAEAREAIVALELFEPSEVEGLKNGTLSTAWTSAYLNTLPDSAFLHVDTGGLRHFPYKDAASTVDAPHLRNALARIPQSSLPKNVQEKLTARAERILDTAKSVDATHKEKGAEGRGSREVDPLRKQADDVALEFHGDGLDRHKPPRKVEPPKQEPEMGLKELRQKMFDEILTLLSD